MTTYSVGRDSTSKSYLWLVPGHGLEMGFGQAGEHEAHAHRHFVDVIYCPAGMRLSPGEEECTMAIVPPRVAFGPTATGEFFFLKFLLDDATHVIPDKVTGEELASFARTPEPARLLGAFERTLPWFDPREGAMSQISLRCDGEVLTASSPVGWELTILP